ncbi:hypothetical protein TTHT_1073 [Thermotomaculum hydrothermale]|uniref:Uncharacterized protein n=2 Tax=Thermotomaculum hydrothermale TaxID=981385 RepID=A0A7R6SYJ0_9BACT|nr:hypothetical protein TTHT_1073 [Thermotomaculum hydrothermale]
MRFVMFLIVFSFSFLLCASDGIKVSTDFSLGYSFLNSDRGNFYRNHFDLSEGELIDYLKINVTNNKKNSFFDEFYFFASTGDRFDNGRLVKFTLKKSLKWRFKFYYKQDFDYFYLPDYNFGSNNRNLVRSRLNLSFNYKVNSNLNLFANYTKNKVHGYLNLPHQDWSDIYNLSYLKRTSYEAFELGLNYRINRLSIIASQSVGVLDKPVLLNKDVNGLALNNMTTSLAINSAGENTSDLNTSKLLINYNLSKLSVGLSMYYTNGSIKNNLNSNKSFIFLDAGSRNDFFATVSGSADAPEYIANFNLTYMPSDKLTLGYVLDYNSLKTESNLAKSLEWVVYGVSDTPVFSTNTSSIEYYYYKHHRNANSFFIDYNITNNVSVNIKSEFYNDDYIYHDNNYQTASNHNEIGFDLKLSKLRVKASVFHEYINAPIFRNAGKNRNGYTLSANYLLNDRLSFSGSATQITKNNDDENIDLKDDSLYYNASINYSYSKGYFSLGYTRMEIDFSSLLFINENINVDDNYYELSENAFYLSGTYKFNRFFARLRLYYYDDSGDSFPLQNWECFADLTYTVNKWLSIWLKGTYLDYSEDKQSIYNYNINQIACGLRIIK